MPRVATHIRRIGAARICRFKGFGRCGTGTDPDNRFAFETIKPGPIGDGQAPHVNVILFMRGMLCHVYTRIYFDDEAAANARDPVLASVEEARRHTLIAARQTTPAGPSTASTCACRGRTRPCSSTSETAAPQRGRAIDGRGLHLRLRAHADRPVRRRARRGARRRPRRGAAQSADEPARAPRLGRGRRRGARLRQSGRRGQPQRRAHGAAARRAAARKCPAAR